MWCWRDARFLEMALWKNNILRNDNAVIDTQFSTGYESSSEFRDAFSRIIGSAPTHSHHLILKAAWIDTKLGPMIAIADDAGLYLLEFADRRGLEREIERLRKRMKAAIIPGEASIIKKIEKELMDYFDGKNADFKTPLKLMGSDFQKNVWGALQKIPPSETRSYLDIANTIKKPTAFRAVANANGANQLAIIIPCHRVINANGDLGGYGGGISRKQWLIEHEKKHYE